MADDSRFLIQSPVTVDKLLSLAVETEDYFLREQAMMAAEWMESNGIKEASHVGPFGPKITFKRGDKTRVNAGSKISSTSERNRTDASARARVVTVHDVYEGWVGRGDGSMITVRQPQVHWAGTNGYWCWTNMDNVEAHTPS